MEMGFLDPHYLCKPRVDLLKTASYDDRQAGLCLIIIIVAVPETYAYVPPAFFDSWDQQHSLSIDLSCLSAWLKKNAKRREIVAITPLWS